MRLLFAKHSLVWPRTSGHDVHTYYMMKACAALGHDVSLATVTEPSATALAGVRLHARFRLSAGQSDDRPTIGGNRLQERFRSFWGVGEREIAALRGAAAESRAEAVIVVGLDALPYFLGLSGVTRIWYAADEWVWHHLSQIRFREPRTWRSHLWAAAVKGLYEQVHAGVIDRVWVVSDAERRAMRWFGGMRRVDVVPNGVDGEYFRPGDEVPEECTAVFWGRLDFGPNVQALAWFCRSVWPLVRRRVPGARFTIAGFHPSAEVRQLAAAEGISIVPDLADLRSTVRRCSLAVLPFVSGGGIKNKLLEAAALGMPIVCTRLATLGLRAADRAPLVVTDKSERMADAICDLWRDGQRRRQIGSDIRKWVLENHSWTVTAREAITAFGASVTGAAA